MDLGKTFYLTKGKLEVDDNPSLYSPSKTELEPSKQAIYLAGGGIPRGLSSQSLKLVDFDQLSLGVLYVS